ncbi:MAG: amidohydrolase family protein, partial [Raoultibacter sp.]
MLLCAQYVLPITSAPIEYGAVLLRENTIRDIGKADVLKLRYPEEEVRDYGLAALLPGLVDLHTHLENSVMRGIVHDVPYSTWINSVNEKSSLMNAGDWYDSAILGGLEALSSGITCVADITSTGAACYATQKLGLRSVIYREVGAMDKRRVDYAMKLAAADIKKWKTEVDASRITIGIAPTALFVCHPSVFRKIS